MYLLKGHKNIENLYFTYIITIAWEKRDYQFSLTCGKELQFILYLEML